MFVLSSYIQTWCMYICMYMHHLYACIQTPEMGSHRRPRPTTIVPTRNKPKVCRALLSSINTCLYLPVHLLLTPYPSPPVTFPTFCALRTFKCTLTETKDNKVREKCVFFFLNYIIAIKQVDIKIQIN